MLGILEALDVHDGHQGLEIGTGKGYNAALLAARLGGGAVTTIEIGQRLVWQPFTGGIVRITRSAAINPTLGSVALSIDNITLTQGGEYL